MPVSRSLIASAVLFLAASFTLAGCGGGSNPSGGNNGGGGSSTPSPQTALSVSSLSFGNVSVGQTSASQSVTVTNTGTITLSILSAPASSDTTDYQMASTCGASLAANANCTITVAFKPQSAASLPATITFTDNSGNVNTTHTISLSGTGGAAPFTSLSVTSLNFGSVPAGQASATQTVTVTNTGSAALTIASLTLADPADYIMATTCGTSVAASGSCTITVAFQPQSAASLPSTITLTDNSGNVSGTTHTITLSGTGTSVSSPIATLSANSVTFSQTNVGVTSATQTVTLTNTGGSALTINSIVLGGTNATSFTENNNCPASLAYNASCALLFTFTPSSSTTFTASVTISDNAANSPQTISLSGTGTNTSAVSYALYALPDSGSGYGSGLMTKLYSMIDSATTSIDMTMYELQDNTFATKLAQACTRGVKVRALLDQGEKSNNSANAATINAGGSNCSAVYSNSAFANTHEKSVVFDGTTLVIMSLNLQTKYYTTTRDFAMIYNDPVDIAAVQATFEQDYAVNGTKDTTEFNYPPGPGNDLIWSPTTAQTAMEGIINGAQHTLLLENEELANSASYIVNDLIAACQRGVTVNFAIVNQSDYQANYTKLVNGGCGVHTVPDTSNGFYIHAKAVIADYGLNTQKVYMGSINYSNGSMNNNRELGMYITDPASVQFLFTTMNSDYTNATPWP